MPNDDQIEPIESAPPWRFSTIYPPGIYWDNSTHSRVYWSGAPRWIAPGDEGDRQAELNAAAQMRALGYRSAEATPVGVDRGIDIEGEGRPYRLAVRSLRVLAQVKREAHRTGEPAVRNLLGSGRRGFAGELWFFSAAGYAKPALSFANDESILLFTYSVEGDLQPATKLAEKRLTELLALRPWQWQAGQRSPNPKWYEPLELRQAIQKERQRDDATWREREVADERIKELNTELEDIIRRKEIAVFRHGKGRSHWVGVSSQNRELPTLAPVVPIETAKNTLIQKEA